MPLPRWVAHVNRRVTNRVARRVAGRLPSFGVVVHTGRVSGTRYRTPVNVFEHGSQRVVALTYGAEADWVRNVLHAGGCTLRHRGHTSEFVRPHVVRDASRRLVPAPIRPVLGVLAVDQFLVLDPRESPRRDVEA